MILALDTSGGAVVACLLDDALQLERARVLPGRLHQEVVLEVIEEVLGGPAEVAGLAAIAVVRGPGSQTGLRVGLATASGLAFAGRLPLLALSSLAVAALRAEGTQEVVAVVSAGRSRVYAQRADHDRELVGPRVLCEVAEIPERIDATAALAVSGETSLMELASASGIRMALPVRGPEDALAIAAGRASRGGPLLAYHQLTGDYGES